jgi:hypothetical protein
VHDLLIAMGAVLFGELIYAALEQMFWFTAMRPVDGVVGAFAGIIIYLVASPFYISKLQDEPNVASEMSIVSRRESVLGLQHKETELAARAN